jgi:uncharacterized lipoprotein YddW (UPF0748 family)
MAWTLAGNPKESKAGTLSTRGVWVSCFEYSDIGLTAQKTESEFRANADKLFYNINANGCNTVYFHVRSYDDAIYSSSVTGWSKRFLDGGTAPSYDPLKILIEYAHKYGIRFHAWMNPYRLTKKTTLDPGNPATTTRILKQVREILNRYSVDGIHFDDYFYTSEKKYKNISTKERMANVNDLVHKVHKAARKKGKVFGISPAGDISYCTEIGADIRTWMSETGYVDYIVPQIYWSDNYVLNGKKTKLFKKRLAVWRSLNKRDIPMYIGMALYKAGETVKNDNGWKKSSTNLSRQLNQIRSGNTEGYVLFCYTDLYRENAWKEVKNFLANIGTVRLNYKKVKLKAGKSFRLQVSTWPSRLKNAVTFKSANTKIATVTAKGKVKAKKAGVVRIYAYCGNKKKRCLLRVKKK